MQTPLTTPGTYEFILTGAYYHVGIECVLSPVPGAPKRMLCLIWTDVLTGRTLEESLRVSANRLALMHCRFAALLGRTLTDAEIARTPVPSVRRGYVPIENLYVSRQPLFGRLAMLTVDARGRVTGVSSCAAVPIAA